MPAQPLEAANDRVAQRSQARDSEADGAEPERHPYDRVVAHQRRERAEAGEKPEHEQHAQRETGPEDARGSATVARDFRRDLSEPAPFDEQESHCEHRGDEIDGAEVAGAQLPTEHGIDQDGHRGGDELRDHERGHVPRDEVGRLAVRLDRRAGGGLWSGSGVSGLNHGRISNLPTCSAR